MDKKREKFIEEKFQVNVWDLEGDENTQFYAEVTESPDSDYPDKIMVGIKCYNTNVFMFNLKQEFD